MLERRRERLVMPSSWLVKNKGFAKIMEDGGRLKVANTGQTESAAES